MFDKDIPYKSNHNWVVDLSKYKDIPKNAKDILYRPEKLRVSIIFIEYRIETDRKILETVGSDQYKD